MLEKRSWFLIGFVIVILFLSLFLFYTHQKPDGVFYSCYPACNPIKSGTMGNMLIATLIAVILIVLIILKDLKSKRKHHPN